MKNVGLASAKSGKKDEFYTQLSDIQLELKNYTDKFKGKVVLCNCDDPFESNFIKYFLMNFNRLELKELIATGYKTSPFGGLEFGTINSPYVLRVKSYLNGGLTSVKGDLFILEVLPGSLFLGSNGFFYSSFDLLRGLQIGSQIHLSIDCVFADTGQAQRQIFNELITVA